MKSLTLDHSSRFGMTLDSHTERQRNISTLLLLSHYTQPIISEEDKGIPAFIGLPGAKEKTERKKTMVV